MKTHPNRLTSTTVIANTSSRVRAQTWSPGYDLRGLLLAACLAICFLGNAAELEFTVQTRERGSDKVVVAHPRIDPKHVGIVIVDMWNYHWCMTWAEQAGGMYTRMNKALEGARKLGMTVLWAPTDVAGMYAGTPQRERALATPYVPLPKVREYHCAFTIPYGTCHCGPGIPCVVNYGHDGMHPGIVIAPDDLIVSGTQELYSICKAHGLTQLLYMGGAVNICLTGKPEGLKPMYEAGLDGWVARDLVEAWTEYNPKKGFTPDMGTAQSVVDLERAGVPTLNMVDELRAFGLWDDKWVTEPVRITPAGTTGRPYFFEQSVAISLNTPWLVGAQIHYTLDGTQPPSSQRFTQNPSPLPRPRHCGSPPSAGVGASPWRTAATLFISRPCRPRPGSLWTNLRRPRISLPRSRPRLLPACGSPRSTCLTKPNRCASGTRNTSTASACAPRRMRNTS